MKHRHLTAIILLRGVVLAVAVHPLAVAAQDAPAAMTPEEEKAADMRMPDIDRSGLLPELRQPLKVSPDERNPFAVARKVLERIPGIVTDTERERIERLLRAMRVSGVSESPSGRRALLGSLSLGQGDELPKLFADQADRLVVKSITDRELVIEFLDGESSKRGQPLSLPIGVDSGPDSVRSLLVGEAFRKAIPMDEDGAVALPARQSAGAQALLQSAEAQEFGGLVDRPTELFDAPAEISNESEER